MVLIPVVTGSSHGSTYLCITFFVVWLLDNVRLVFPNLHVLVAELYSYPEQTSSEYHSEVAELLFTQRIAQWPSEMI